MFITITWLINVEIQINDPTINYNNDKNTTNIFQANEIITIDNCMRMHTNYFE